MIPGVDTATRQSSRSMCRNLPVTSLWLACLFVVGGAPSAWADEVTEAISAIRKLGGSVRSVGKEWEVDFHLRGRRLTDKDLSHVAVLKDVAWLNVSKTRVTSAGLVHLKRLDKLRWLHLEMTGIGDKGMEHVAGLPRLEYLNLYATKVTDKSLEKLAKCKKLKRLYVWRTGVTDAGVARLRKSRTGIRIVKGLDLDKLASVFPSEVEKPKSRVSLKWVAVTSRDEAPLRSENGINCEILFENKSKRPVKLFWISYGKGELKFYARLAPGAIRKQNSYSKNAWLVTDDSDQPLGYFVVKQDDSRAVIPESAP